MNAKTINKKLFSFLQQSPSPFHAVRTMSNSLHEKGFKPLDEKKKWQVKAGQPYYVIREDGALIAFNIGTENADAFRIVGSHSDSPCLKVKPKPDVFDKKYHKIGVEVYGGALLNPWFDKELSIAGRATYRTEKNKIYNKLVDFGGPIAVIPSLAIHLDRNANKERSINPQKDITPIIGLDNQERKHFSEILIDVINKNLESNFADAILSYDLFLYDFQPPCNVGVNSELILGSRLDNLLSCFIASKAIAHANTQNSFMFVCNNHEEVGSNTTSGAEGNLLLSVMERLFPDSSKRHQVLANTFFISIDNAHAVHPNFTEKHEPSHDIFLNVGPVLKINANQRYTSDGVSSAVFKSLCSEVDVTLQEFVMRNDLACGSTIGPVTAAKLGIQTVDIGAASLAMHSIKELTGHRDPLFMFKVINHFLQTVKLPVIH